MQCLISEQGKKKKNTLWGKVYFAAICTRDEIQLYQRSCLPDFFFYTPSVSCYLSIRLQKDCMFTSHQTLGFINWSLLPPRKNSPRCRHYKWRAVQLKYFHTVDSSAASRRESCSLFARPTSPAGIKTKAQDSLFRLILYQFIHLKLKLLPVD